MGHDDRLHGKGNFENWMSDTKKKTITLVDNAMSPKDLRDWSSHPDVIALAAGKFDELAKTITDELEAVLVHGGYGGGKLSANDQGLWATLRPAFEKSFAVGLDDGRLNLMRNGWGLVNSLGAASPLAARVRERLEFIHARM